MENVTLGDVRYNAQIGAFEARVDVRRNGSTYRYPCMVSGPLTMEPEHVRAGLARHALRQSDTGANLRSVL